MNQLFRRWNPSATIAASSVLLGSSVAVISSDTNNNTVNKRSQCDNHPPIPSEVEGGDGSKRSRLIFLGTGSSTGCPKPLCSLLFQDDHKTNGHTTINNKSPPDSELSLLQQSYLQKCHTSRLALRGGDPRTNKNYRNNPSLLISHCSSGTRQNIIIDVGKTFRETALRWLPHHHIQSLDAVILTHHHMDAVAGLDDLRGFQRFTVGQLIDPNSSDGRVSLPPQRVPISVFLSQECLDQVSSQFPWLFPNQQPKATTTSTNASKDEKQQPCQCGDDDGSKEPGASPPLSTSASTPTKPVVKRDVAALDVQVIEDFKAFQAKGLKVVPLPVWHGDDLICLGFAFSLPNAHDGQTNIVYLSDLSRMIPETLEYIQTQLPPTDIFVVDCLLENRPHPVHFNLHQAIDLARQIRAKQTYLIGMNCDSFPEHDTMNEELSKLDISVQFAHDGQEIEL